MTRSPLVAIGTLAIAALAAVPLVAQQSASPYPPAKPETAAPAGTAARGAQLVMLGGCHDCHTPKLPTGELDKTRLLSGHPESAPLAPEVAGGVTTNMLLTAWRGPWGLTLTRNLTPDPETGLGRWTFENFEKTLRTGVNPKGEILRPPMPIAMYQNLPASDLKAIWAYLRTLKPIRNNVGRVGPTSKTAR